MAHFVPCSSSCTRAGLGSVLSRSSDFFSPVSAWSIKKSNVDTVNDRAWI